MIRGKLRPGIWTDYHAALFVVYYNIAKLDTSQHSIKLRVYISMEVVCRNFCLWEEYRNLKISSNLYLYIYIYRHGGILEIA